MDGFKFKIGERVVSMDESRGYVLEREPNTVDPLYRVRVGKDVVPYWERELDSDKTYYVDRNRKLEQLL